MQMVAMGVVSVPLEVPIHVVYGAASAVSAHLGRERLIERNEVLAEAS